MANICFLSLWFGKSTKNNSSNRPLRVGSGGRTVPLFQVAATTPGAFLSCIHERNEPSRREETPASTDAESAPLPAKTFSNSSIHNTQGANTSATRKTFSICFSLSPIYLSKMDALSNLTRGSFHSPAIARAQRDLPHPCTPKMITPLAGSRPNFRAKSSQEPRRCASHCFKLSKPPTPDSLSEASINSSDP